MVLPSASVTLFACFVLLRVVTAKDSNCFKGGFAHMYELCCVYGFAGCWDADGEYTFDRCCLDATPPGDETCWIEPYDFHACCEGYHGWFPRADCFDGHYTFERCCGGHVAVTMFGARQRLKRFGYGIAHVIFGGRPLIIIAALSVIVRILRRFCNRYLVASAQRPQSPSLGRGIRVPAAGLLRIFATCGIVAWHSLGNCGFSRTCDVDMMETADPPRQVVSSLFLVQTDIFFVLSSYLATAGALCRARDSPPLRHVFADGAAAVLRRVVRTAPAIVVAASAGYMQVGPFFAESWPGHFFGVTWPYGKPKTWPFGVELLCLAAVEALLALGSVAGMPVSLATSAALLGACLERRHRAGAANGCKDPLSPNVWFSAHLAIGGHRLPLCFATVLLTILVHARPQRTGLLAGNPLDGKVEQCPEGISDAQPPTQSDVFCADTRAANPKPADSKQTSPKTASPKPAAKKSAGKKGKGFAASDVVCFDHNAHAAIANLEPATTAGICAESISGISREVSMAGMFLPFVWVVALAGILATALLEWCWNYGPRVVLPWWIYPFPVKLPLIVGCVLLLETSRRAAVAGAAVVPDWLPVIERRSLGVLVMHEFVETVWLQSIPNYKRDQPMFWFELPGVLVWSYAAASLLLCLEEPFRQSLDSGLAAVHAAARPVERSASASRAWLATAGLLLASACCVGATLRRACKEPWPSPCHL